MALGLDSVLNDVEPEKAVVPPIRNNHISPRENDFKLKKQPQQKLRKQRSKQMLRLRKNRLRLRHSNREEQGYSKVLMHENSSIIVIFLQLLKSEKE